VVFNAVDLERFRMRGPLPAKPRRALVFSNYIRENSGLAAIRDACSRIGIEVDLVGGDVPTDRPEEILGRYDIVFAKAKSAIEALAVGCAVVLCSGNGVGPLVTSENFDRLRRLNFGVRSLREDLRPDVFAAQIACYDSVDAAQVCRRIREVAGLDAMIEEVVAIYDEVLDEHSRAGGHEDLEAKASAAYLA